MLFAPKHSCRKAQRAASSWESRTKRRGGLHQKLTLRRPHSPETWVDNGNAALGWCDKFRPRTKILYDTAPPVSHVFTTLVYHDTVIFAEPQP